MISCADIKTSPVLAALAYREHLPGRFHPLKDGSKTPRLASWPAVASNEPEQIQAWAKAYPDANLGFVADPDYFVADIDRKKGVDGFVSLARIERELGPLPETLTAVTPNGGQHLFFRGPEDMPYKTCANAGDYKGVDIRAGGASAGYVVMAPSVLDEGAYSWLNWPDLSVAPHIAEAPRWMVELACGMDPLKLAAAKAARDDFDEDDFDTDDFDEDDLEDELFEHLASAIKVIDHDDYDSWIKAGHALKTLDNPDAGLKIWLTWSARSKLFDEADARKRWDGFKPTNTSYKVIFAEAQALGWKNPGKPKAKSGKGGGASADITDFNKTHAVVIAGGSVCIMREGLSEFGGSEICFMRKDALATFYQNRTTAVERTTPDGETVLKREPLVKEWLSHPDRRTHEGVTFAPNGKAPAGFYNLWRGYSIEPSPFGVAASALRCRRFLRHLKFNICSGNRYHFRYLLAWFGDMIQDPCRKKGVALVLRGKKGTGKSKVADVARKMLGGHAFKASKSEHIVGRFSAHLADKLLIVAEESFFAGSKADIGTLKDMLTSDTITIEPKGINPFEAKSCHRILMSTNSEWAVPATEDERRFFVLDVAEHRMQDSDYFAAIDAEMFDGDGLASFLTLLQKLDISKVNLRKIPQTKALENQKRLSLEPHDQFIYDCLMDGEIAGEEWKASAGPKNDPFRQDVYLAYVLYAKALQVRPISSNRFGPHFEQRTGAITHQPNIEGERRRRYEMPACGEALARFNRQLGIKDDLE